MEPAIFCDMGDFWEALGAALAVAVIILGLCAGFGLVLKIEGKTEADRIKAIKGRD